MVVMKGASNKPSSLRRFPERQPASDASQTDQGANSSGVGSRSGDDVPASIAPMGRNLGSLPVIQKSNFHVDVPKNRRLASELPLFRRIRKALRAKHDTMIVNRL